MQILTMQIKKIKPYPNNPRKNSGAVEAVAESIRQCGYCAPIVVDEDFVVLAGHTRLKAIKRLGWKECEVCVREGLTEEQKKKYRLLDNKTNEFAEWDDDLLAQELENLDFEGFDFGFEDVPIEKNVVEDEYDEPVPVMPKSKIGDLYQLGRHRLLCGDSTNLADVKRLCGDQLMDMLLTDPPYNVDYEGAAGKIQNDNMSDSAFREFLRNAFCCAKEVLKPGGAFYIWHSDSEGYNFRGACNDAGLRVRQCLIWVKNSIVLGRQDFQWKHEPCLYGENPLSFPLTDEYEDDEHEPCLYGWKDGKHYWFKNRKQSTILEFDKPTKSKEHPTMKPVKLFDYAMKCSTAAEQNVLDLFGGSGTTIIAAEQNERNAYVMEFDPKYVDVIIDRWERFSGEDAILIE